MTRAEWARRPGRSSNYVRRSLRMAIYARDNFECIHIEVCGGVFPRRLDGVGLTLDHVVPRSKGGKSRADNLVTTCAYCNCSRQNRQLGGDALDRALLAIASPINRELGRALVRLHGFPL